LHTTERQDHGVGLLTRFEVKEEEVFKLQDYSFLSLRAVLDVDGVDVTVFVIHPRSPDGRVNPITYNSSDRAAELETLHDDYLANTTGPILLLCDCNMSDQSDDYEELDTVMDDAFREQGRWVGFTFGTRTPITLPFLRVDYIWHSVDIVTKEVGPWGGLGASDHRPVKATLALREAAEPDSGG
jgi:endonuclease/exonuclease/phosphatase family metal-dependent hydrolase